MRARQWACQRVRPLKPTEAALWRSPAPLGSGRLVHKMAALIKVQLTGLDKPIDFAQNRIAWHSGQLSELGMVGPLFDTG